MRRKVPTLGFVFLLLSFTSGSLFAQLDAESPFDLEPTTALNSDAPRAQQPDDRARFIEIAKLESQVRSHDGSDKSGRDALVKELTTLMEGVFDADYAVRDAEVRKLEERVGRLRAALDRRKSARERILQNRIDGLLLDADGLAFPSLMANRGDKNPRHEVISVRKLKNGSSVAKVRVSLPQTRRRTVNYTFQVPQTKSRIVGGVEQEFTFMVPETRSRSEEYTIYVPEGRTHEVTIPKGRDVSGFIAEFAKTVDVRRARRDVEQFGDHSSNDAILFGADDMFGPAGNSFEDDVDGELFNNEDDSQDDIFEDGGEPEADLFN